MFSTNGAGIVRGKLKSLRAEVINTNPSLVTIQETHCRKKGKILFSDMIFLKPYVKPKMVAH